MGKGKVKVLILGSPLDYIDRDYLERFLRGDDYCVDVLYAKDRAETKEKLGGKVAADGPYEALVVKMGTTPYEPFNADLLAPLLPTCRLIASASAGYDEFDVPWMTGAGIHFCNTVGAVAEPTADMALFLLLATVRDTSVAERQARRGGWKAGLAPSGDPRGKVLGIVGMGSIGRYVARKAGVFGLEVWYHNRRRLTPEEEEELGARWCEELDSLLRVADIVTLHTPLNEGTKGMISRPQFARMKEGSFLINTARGAIVDEEAMIEALESGKLARAGLDVFPDEPNIHEYLRRSEKVVLQPHMGGLTESAFAKSQEECLENIRAFFEKGVPNSPVNCPEG